jgi:hypothetical protein
VLGDRELVRPKADGVRYEGVSVLVGVGPGEVGQPAPYLAVLARRMNPRRVVLPPRSQDDRVVVKLDPVKARPVAGTVL